MEETRRPAATSARTLDGVAEWVNLRLAVISAAGVSAGVHAALVPAHYDESRFIGISFVLAAVALAVVSAGLAVWPGSRLISLAAAALFAALLIAYIVLRDDPFDAIAAVTKVLEAVGLVGALRLAQQRVPTRPGDLALAYFGFAFVLAFVIAAGAHAHGH